MITGEIISDKEKGREKDYPGRCFVYGEGKGYLFAPILIYPIMIKNFFKKTIYLYPIKTSIQGPYTSFLYFFYP